MQYIYNTTRSDGLSISRGTNVCIITTCCARTFESEKKCCYVYIRTCVLTILVCYGVLVTICMLTLSLLYLNDSSIKLFLCYRR